MNELFGPIKWPSAYGSLGEGGLTEFISNIVYLIATVGGLFAFINIVLAGFQYISAGGDTKATQAAWSRIYMSLIGLVIIISSFLLAGIIGMIFFGKWDAILNPQIVGPGSS